MLFNKSTIIASLFAVCAWASPLTSKPDTQAVARRGDVTPWSPHISFNRWRNLDSLDHFDDFYGVDNFDGRRFKQVIVKERELVCRTRRIEIVQQRLVVLRELAKRIIVENICDVETQVIAWEQFHGSLGHFKGDLRRISGRRVGFDHAIAGRFGELFEGDGRITSHHLGFSGLDVGLQTVVLSNDNWDDRHSFQTVNDAYFLSRHAHRLGSRFERDD